MNAKCGEGKIKYVLMRKSELSQFDAQIERDKRDQQRLLRQPEFGEHRRKAEAMDKSEAERDEPVFCRPSGRSVARVAKVAIGR